MRLSAASVSFEQLSLEAVAGVARDLGFLEWDIYGHSQRARGHLEPAEIAENPQKAADRVRRIRERSGLTVSDFFPTFGVGVEDRAVNHPNALVRKENRELFRKMVEFTRLIGSPGVTISPGVQHPSMRPEVAFETAITALTELMQVAGEKGVRLRVEPHVGSVLHTPELALEAAERTGAKITLDYSHFYFLYVLPERTHKLIPFTDHFHLRPARMGALQVRWSENTIEFGDILQRLKDAGYRGAVSIECVCQDWYGANRIDVLTETAIIKRDVEQLLATQE